MINLKNALNQKFKKFLTPQVYIINKFKNVQFRGYRDASTKNQGKNARQEMILHHNSKTKDEIYLPIQRRWKMLTRGEAHSRGQKVEAYYRLYNKTPKKGHHMNQRPMGSYGYFPLI